MRTLRLAAISTAVAGLGVISVGCGQVASVTSQMDTKKMKEEADKAKDRIKDKGQEVVDKAKEEAKALADKVKAMSEEASKDIKPIEQAMSNLGEKIKEAGGDVAKLEPLTKIKTDAEVLLKELKDKIAGLAQSKDMASLDGAKKAIGEVVTKLKDLLKDYLPK